MVRNTEVEASLDRKMKPRYLGPMIVVAQSSGGSFVIAEMDGSVFHQKVAKFHVIPYFAWTKINLPENWEELMGISKSTLKKIVKSDETKEEEIKNKDYSFEGVCYIRVQMGPNFQK